MEIIGKARARLADVQCTRLQFQPGDRVLVRVRQPLSGEQRRRLQKTVERWAGDCVEVLIVDTSAMEVFVERGRNIEPV